MTTLKTGYSVLNQATFAYVNGRIYCTNDFDRVQVWDGLYSSMRDAGIASPGVAMAGPNSTAAGNCTAGQHLIRYRYSDSTSPAGSYRSNTSTALTYVVIAGQQSLTFTITAGGGGGNIIRSTDTKVDTIIVEMTAAAGTTYYAATSVANSATSVTVNLSDVTLVQNDRAALYDGDELGVGHEQPPLGSIIAQCKNYTFIGGFSPLTFTVGVTNGLTAVTGTGFSTLWTGRKILISGDSASYEIASATTTTITLTTAYAGSTNASISSTVFSKNPNRIYWSAYNNGAALCESWKALSRARDMLNGKGDRLTGMIGYQGDLWITGLHTIERLVFDDDPATGEPTPIVGSFGVWNQRCLVAVDEALYGWGPNGVWFTTGGRPRWISKPIDATVAALYDLTKMSQAHGHFDPVNKLIRFFYVKSGETTPREAMALDVMGGRLYRSQFRQGIDASVVIANANGQLLPALSDSTNGYTWTGTGATDGVPSSSSGAYTVASGSTTTVINVINALPTGSLGSNLNGVMFYNLSTGEERVISSNTASTITLGTALALAPSAGAAVYAGAIPWSITTNWYEFDGLETKKQAHFYLYFVPSTAGAVRVAIYADFSASPLQFTYVDSTIKPNGVTWNNGDSYCTVAFDSTSVAGGFVKIPMFMNWSRSLRAVVTCLSPAGTLQLLDAGFKLTDKRSSKTVTDE